MLKASTCISAIVTVPVSNSPAGMPPHCFPNGSPRVSP